VTREPDQLLSEFIDAWNGGRRPRVNDYLEQAPAEQRGELADDIARFLDVAPSPAYSPEALEAVRAEAAALEAREALPSLLARARARARVSLRELGSSLASALGVADAEKTARYLGELESGALDPRGVSRRALDAIASALGVRPDQLVRAAHSFSAAPVAPSAAAGGALWRAEPEAAASERADLEILADALAAPAPEPWDEVDRLFLGGD
jgi:hypothetical protein